MVVPLGLLHLAAAIIGVIYSTEAGSQMLEGIAWQDPRVKQRFQLLFALCKVVVP